MASSTRMALTVGVGLIKLLERYQVEHVFGIPGVHTIELYRGLADSHIQHHTPRHEQGAGFMADGYARVSRKPGVCFVITGPGLTNIMTPMGQALADSIPLLIISSVNDSLATPNTRGRLHEMPNQLAASSTVTRFSQTIVNASELPGALATAFSLFASARPGPVHLQLPVSLLGGDADPKLVSMVGSVASAVAPDASSIHSAASLINGASNPLILTGGGAVGGAQQVKALAEKMDSPVHMTINSRGLLSYQHPLAVPASCTLHSVREKVNEADVVLALGTELADTDYDQYKDGEFHIDGKLIRCDIEAVQINNNQIADVAVIGDVAATASALLEAVESGGDNGGSARAEHTMRAAFEELGNDAKRHLQLLEAIRDDLPDCIFVGDSTQLIYSGNMIFNTEHPLQWFNSSVGFGTLGYALPAATGAAIAVNSTPGLVVNNANKEVSRCPVVCIIGDGGMQFVLGELGALKDTGLAIAVIVWCNNGYREIKTSMENANVTSVGVEFSVPDFVGVARSYGIKGVRVNSDDALCREIQASFEAGEPILIELNEDQMMSTEKRL